MDLEAEYNNRARVPEHLEIRAGWQREAAKYRASQRSELDLPYGTGERKKFDLFHPDSGPGSEVVVYIHGGYWQYGEREEYSHIAAPFTASGLSVAVVSYGLCPETTLPEIIEQLRASMIAVWKKTGARPIVTGHSAGGHLAAAMLVTDWSEFDGVPQDLVRNACAISGVFDLEPLLHIGMNENLKLTEATVDEVSPIKWTVSGEGRRLVVTVGGAESSEFLRQSRELATVWGEAGIATEYLEVENGNHFTVVEAMMRPDGEIAQRVLAFGRGD